MEETRQIVRCLRCTLVQFMTRSTNCRKCGASLIIVVAPPKVEVVQPRKRAPHVRHSRTEGYRLAAAFAIVIARERKAQGISQLRLSARSGIVRSYINSMEHGYTGAPRPETVAKLAQGLGVTPDVLNALVEAVL